MKKRLATAVLAMVMAASVLTACGGDKGAGQQTGAQAPAAGTKTETQDTETEAKASAEGSEADNPGGSAEAGMVSDEDFGILQDNYALITEYAQQVREIYTSDEIAANPDIEEVILQTEDVIAQMGELEQGDLTEEDAVTLNETMEIIIETYNNLLDGMEAADNGENGGTVSDATFAELGGAYDALTDIYNTVAEAYNNSGAENADIKAAMDEAYGFLEQMGEITQDSITEEDAEALAQAMIDAAEALGLIADNL